jgi:hypothetical protein
LRQRSIDEILPWEFIDVGIPKELLVAEYQKAKQIADNV